MMRTPWRQRSVLITGLPQRARTMADELSHLPSHWQFRLIPLSRHPLTRKLQLLPLLRELSRSALYYQIGGALGRGRLVALARRLGVPAVVHWVGSDVLEAHRYLARSSRFACAVKGAIHWAVAPWLVAELAQSGIPSELVSLPCSSLRQYLTQPPPPLPDHLAVLSYLPDEKPKLYRRDDVLQLAQDFPGVRFLVVGGWGTGLTQVPPNVRFLGWTNDLRSLYVQTSVLIRVVQHDGSPRMVQEALALGRHIVWSYPTPGVRQARAYSELKAELTRLYEAHRNDQLSLNWEGRAHVQSHHDPDRVAQRILAALERVLEPRRTET